MQDLLDLLKEEKEQESNKELKVDTNSQLEQITRGFEKTCLLFDIFGVTKARTDTGELFYKLGLFNIPDSLDIDYIDPNEFISKEILPSNYMDARNLIGGYVSALIERTERDKIFINLNNINEQKMLLNYLGYKNKKEIFIEGEVGYFLGNKMIDGVITINGDCFSVGEGMEKGIINIKCEPGKSTSSLIDTYQTHLPMGEIYYNSKLICKDGKIFE